MNNDFLSILNLQTIFAEIKPISLARNAEFKPFSPHKKQELIDHLQKLGKLIEKIKQDSMLSQSIDRNLIHLQNISTTLAKISRLYSLELFEIQEVKNLLYFYQQIKTELQKNKLEIIQLPEIGKLFSFLDKDDHNSPAFHISSSYSTRYAKLLDKFSKLKKQLSQENKTNLKNAAQKLKIDKPEPQIVVSRMDKEQVEKLQKSKIYYLEDENFANLTFQIKKTDKILEIEKQLHKYEDYLEQEADRLKEKITKVIFIYIEELETILHELTNLDLMMAKAKFAVKYNCFIPKIGDHLELKQARNLPLQWELGKKRINLQPIDIKIDQKVNIITGSNMAGKTTALKTIGQTVYLANCGIPVACEEAIVTLAGFFFFSGSGKNRMDLSSFANEVVEINKVLTRTDHGIILIDEFARGTNPEEGEAFSKAILTSFLQKDSFVVAATHFKAPSQIRQAAHFRIKGITSEDYKKLQKVPNLQNRLQELHNFMDYSLKKVAANSQPPKAALIIAELLGIDAKIIKKAK
ncbi:MAG: hypothetical protein SVM86_04175, partial [Candidatus Cloacimonadota bacterium]|nr:hypothetical protein [Candidatus Cloacimonadota bacterium]